VYRSLMRNKGIGECQTGFVRKAFLEFVTDHWGRGFVDHKLAKRVALVGQPRYVSLAEYSARIGVQPRTAQRILKDCQATAERVICGKSFRTVVDAQSEFVPAKVPGRVLRLRVAARMLGLPVSTLQELKKASVFEVKHLPPGHPGWHEGDIQSFTAKLLKSTVQNAVAHRNAGDHRFSLGRIMNNRHLSPTAKAALITGVLTGSIAVSGPVSATIDGIQIYSDDYKRFLSDMRKRTLGDSRTPTEVAAVLHCDRATVPGLFDGGFLTGSRTPLGLRVDNESVARFAAEYVSLASKAKLCGTSVRALMRKCERAGLHILIIAVKHRRTTQPFVRQADLHQLLAEPM